MQQRNLATDVLVQSGKSLTRPADETRNIMELPAGNKSMIYWCWFASRRRRFLSHSNWSHFIAPYRSILVRFIPGINIRLRCGATIRSLQSNASGCSVACVGKHVAILGDSDITSNHPASAGHSIPKNRIGKTATLKPRPAESAGALAQRSAA
jgi:hypothetical protein